MKDEPSIKEIMERVEETRREVRVSIQKLEGRVLAVERETDNHKKEDMDSFQKLRAELAELQGIVLSNQSAQDIKDMAQLHILGCVARKVGVSKRELDKVKVLK